MTAYDYRECSLLWFTEAWLYCNLLNTLPNLIGISLVWVDRGKQRDKQLGGLAVFVNNKWSNRRRAPVKKCMCTLDTEILWWVFTLDCCSIIGSCSQCMWFHFLGYVRTWASASQCRHNNQQGLQPCLPLSYFKQYISCATTENKILHLFYYFFSTTTLSAQINFILLSFVNFSLQLSTTSSRWPEMSFVCDTNTNGHSIYMQLPLDSVVRHKAQNSLRWLERSLFVFKLKNLSFIEVKHMENRTGRCQ